MSSERTLRVQLWADRTCNGCWRNCITRYTKALASVTGGRFGRLTLRENLLKEISDSANVSMS